MGAVLADKLPIAEIEMYALVQLEPGDCLLTILTAELPKLHHRIPAAIAEGVDADALEVRLQVARVRVAE